MNVRVGRPTPAHWPPERLGLLERWYAEQPEPRVAGCVLEFESRREASDVRAALGRLRTRHPWALDVTLRRESRGRWSFQRRPDSELPFGVEPAGPWACAERELLARFVAGSLLWRVRLSGDGRAIVAVFHHVIADGLSTSVFARELLTLLGGGALGGDEDARLPVDVRLDLRPSIRTFAREASAEFRKSAPSYFRGPTEELGARRTRLYPFEVALDVVRALSVRARAEGTTVHAGLITAGLFAIAKSAGFPLLARLLSPISLRPRTAPPPKGIGVYLCGHETDVRLDANAPFWRVASSYGNELAGALPQACEQLGMLRFAGDLSERAARITREHPNARTGTLEVSNLGRLGGLGGARVWFIQGNHYHGPLFNVTAGTCTETGVLRAVLCVADTLVNDDAARSFVRGTLHELERATR